MRRKIVHQVGFIYKMNGFMRLTATCRSAALHRERIVAFSWQEWLRERAPLLRCGYTAPLVLVMKQRTSVGFCFGVHKTPTETLTSWNCWWKWGYISHACLRMVYKIQVRTWGPWWWSKECAAVIFSKSRNGCKRTWTS